MNKEKILARLAATVMRTLARTLRIEVRDEARFVDPKRDHPIIIAAWHNRILVLPPTFQPLRWNQWRPLSVLTSPSRDGGLLAAVVKHFGVDAVRGSSSKRGAVALRELTATLERGSDVMITPDGPRGPVYKVGAGIIFLAQKTGAPIVRMHVDCESFWELKTWDRFRIPKPFSRVKITVFPGEIMEPTASEAEFEEQRQRFERSMMGEGAQESASSV